MGVGGRRRRSNGGGEGQSGLGAVSFSLGQRLGGSRPHLRERFLLVAQNVDLDSLFLLFFFRGHGVVLISERVPGHASHIANKCVRPTMK